MWSVCPRTFDAAAVCKCNTNDLHQHTMMFIHEANAILQKHHGKVVETLEVRVGFSDSSLLVHHINNWVDFAVVSRTKNLTLDLKPKRLWRNINNDHYVLPLEQLDSGSISRLEHMQLSYVSLKPPSHFKGFPNLRKLHIQLLLVSRKDLEHMLSHCSNLAWLHIDRCNLYDHLIVGSPLSNLLYLHIEHCELTSIKFHAVNLATFEYEGRFIPIDLTPSLKLHSVNIEFGEAVFQHAVMSLLNGLPIVVQNLTLRVWRTHLEEAKKSEFYSALEKDLDELLDLGYKDGTACREAPIFDDYNSDSDTEAEPYLGGQGLVITSTPKGRFVY
ncbi:hypothetical protein C2845_PM07G08700 [Panicum miliaceum]|uniref:At1g61320/AtMIF1 LRR domain-containing protein n=1 Tax=Panicum miliaceum TaxID=4540 RepID=A0A3L6SHH4_PANMI|nr:hypothetical protein C2845_PM07G08700 [Panicum miliaceum]